MAAAGEGIETRLEPQREYTLPVDFSDQIVDGQPVGKLAGS